MAVIGKIRSRLGGLLVVLVGGALLLFVVGDFLDSRGGVSAGDRSIGSIDGEDVDLMAFERRVGDEAEALRNDFGQSVDNNTQEQLRNQVWNEIIKERVLKTQVEEAGFGNTLAKEEYDDIRFGNNIVPDFKNQPNFQGPDGQVDPEKIRQWFVNVESMSPVYYEIQKRRMVDNRLYTKYNNLVRQSVFANSAQAKDEFEQKNLKATFNFVVKAFNTEADSLYPVSESDLQSYYSAHKNEKKYQQKASRDFDYVSFTVTATADDIAAIQKELEELRPSFEAATDDSLFCVGNSESRAYSVQPYQPGTLDQLNDSLMTHADTGSVVGPYQESGMMKLAKISELADVPEARVRHILLKSDASNDAAVKARADSMLAVVKRDRSKFEDLVTKFSDDPGSKATGGVYEWFDKNRMVPEFTKASFDEKKGAITICKTTYGYHIVEVLDQRTRKERRICTIDRRIAPSPKTFQAAYKRANEFSLDNTTAEKFKNTADTLGLTITPVDDHRLDQRFVPGLQEPAALLGWVNNAEVNTVSSPIQCGEVYVVALLRSITEEGPPELDDVREIFTKEVVKQKKAEAYTKMMEGKTDLNALASELGLQVQAAQELAFNSYSIPGGFAENEVIGRVFGMQAGQTSGPITGDNGVYVVQLVTTTPAPEVTDVSTEKKMLADRLQGSAEGAVMNALREAAGVVDQRGKYY